MTAKEKQEYKEAAIIAGASGATFGGATIALVEFPPAAAISLMGAGVCFLLEAYNGRKALDPPDPSYKGLATPRFPKPTLLKAAGGITAGEAAAANALLTNTARMVGLDRAFLTSLERAQGAYAARDLVWLRKQSAQASKLARAEAKTLDARPGLEQAVGKAMAAARHTQSVTAAQVRAAQKAGLPRALVALLRSFGVNASELATFRRQLASVSPATVAGPVSSKWGTPALARAERTTAKLLRTLAGRLDKSSKG
jgi:hypothetical protein